MSAIPPLVIHVFVPLRTHSSAASSYTARVRREDTSEPASGSDTAKAASLDLVGGPEALGAPLRQLLGRPVGGDAGQPQGAPEDGQGDAGVAPRQLLAGDGQHQPARVEEALGDEVEGVQPDPGRLLDDRPRRLLALVPLVPGRADHRLGEVVDPLLDLQLVLVEVQGEIGHGALLRSGPEGPVALDWRSVAATGCPVGPRPPPTPGAGGFCSYSIVTRKGPRCHTMPAHRDRAPVECRRQQTGRCSSVRLGAVAEPGPATLRARPTSDRRRSGRVSHLRAPRDPEAGRVG